MPQQLDEQRHINLLRAELLDLGLDWDKQYRLIEEGPRWSLDFNRALELLALIMNR
jgi:hypothetical protein